jgi:hypothetical protein
MPNFYKLICERAYFIGYEQLFLPRRVRRVIAKSEIHRAWLAGNQDPYDSDDDDDLDDFNDE